MKMIAFKKIKNNKIAKIQKTIIILMTIIIKKIYSCNRPHHWIVANFLNRMHKIIIRNKV